jgi:hypothetical protein
MAPEVGYEVGYKLNKRFDLLSTLVLFLFPLIIVSCLIPLLGIPMPKYRNIFVKFYFLGMGTTVSIYGLLVLNAFGFLLRELSSHIASFVQADQDIITVYKRLTLCYYTIAYHCITVALSFFIFGFWDFLLKYTTYVVVYQLIGSALASTVLIFTISGIYRPEKVLPDTHTDTQKDKHIGRQKDTHIDKKKDTYLF